MIELSSMAIDKDDDHLSQLADEAIKKVGIIELSHKELYIPVGIIGFEHVKQYQIELLDKDIIYKLTGLPNNNPVFYLINPYLVCPEYTLTMSDDEYLTIGSPDFKDIVVFALLTLKDDVAEITCNLLGPLVINNQDGVMIQIVNESGDWGTKHLLADGQKITEVEYIDSNKVEVQ